MHRNVISVSLVMAFCSLALLAQILDASPLGNTYYVSTTGKDTNPGTEASPWRTVQKAADTLVAGDTVYIRAGTYKGRVVPKNSGTDANHRITYASYPGERATIDGTGVPVNQYEGLFHIEGKRYITVSGLKVANSSYYGINADGASNIIVQGNVTYKTVSCGIGMWACSNVIIDGNDVSKACSSGQQESISVAQTSRFEVRNNHVHNAPDKEGICLKDGSAYGKVYGNNVHHTPDVGIYVDAWERHTHHIDVYNNVVHDVGEKSGIAVASENGGLNENIRIYNNIVYHNAYVGIEISDWGIGATKRIRRIEITNNTIWGNGIPWGGGITCQNLEAQAILIRNNICSENTAFQIAVAASLYNKAVKVDHNLINRFMGEEGEVRGTGYVEADPLLIDPTKGDFHIGEASPAIDKGASAKAPKTDYEGHVRPQDGDGDGSAKFDIGAYEVPKPGLSQRPE